MVTVQEKEDKLIKDRLDMERERLLNEEIQQYEREKSFKKGKHAIKTSEMLECYDLLMGDMMGKGVPKLKSELFEYAAFFFEKHERKKYFYPNSHLL